ncbi:hypothetical protein COCSUDRAFT_83607 [Coccomyxa subellipsoidea C-169]|uniref:Uncharacterized protein n=1 Tax=Coccomyxa subellipsoidea (strain C-169) TaxID=574566 RepID=I0YIT7_COCSC|nr:hypothetical protein COCSUDRAFT_83607 [Coccomyxa subellipsoidea C-169]EIE18306.1 hypothetical protein COCSUDRAFT_83607 [Coccomyxa subellipsoidea C-169]|eukprot:XP_005642850.1 hypothetical protein COCSUDRAFT_83607 [Coccomyxa subellipsoidea C-169]
MVAGADPKIPFPYGGLDKYTVLHFESYDGNRHGLVADLVRAGADVNQKDDRGYTPLHSAANNSQDATCLTNLKSYPANATVQFFGAAPTLEYLVAQGGNPNAPANDGTKPIDIVPKPDTGNLADGAVWMSGTCKATYDYLKSVSAAASGPSG